MSVLRPGAERGLSSHFAGRMPRHITLHGLGRGVHAAHDSWQWRACRSRYHHGYTIQGQGQGHSPGAGQPARGTRHTAQSSMHRATDTGSTKSARLPGPSRQLSKQAVESQLTSSPGAGSLICGRGRKVTALIAVLCGSAAGVAILAALAALLPFFPSSIALPTCRRTDTDVPSADAPTLAELLRSNAISWTRYGHMQSTACGSVLSVPELMYKNAYGPTGRALAG